jgi:hypothetical protein
MSELEATGKSATSSEAGRGRRKGPVFWVLLLVFIALCAWWTVHFKYEPEKLYRAVPLNAVFVGEHDNLADRWDVVKRNRLVTAGARLAGVGQEEIDGVANDPVIADWITRLASKKTVIGYVPALGRSGQPAWILASWVGAYGQFLRWTALSSLVPGTDFETIRFDGGRKAWALEESLDTEAESQWRLSLAIADGVLLACMSPDPEGVCRLVEQMESSCPVVSAFAGREAGDEADGRSTESGWLRWAWKEKGVRTYHELGYSVRLDESGGSSGRIASDIRLPEAASLAESVDTKDLEKLLGQAPTAFCTVPFEYIEMLWPDRGEPQYVRIVRKGLESVTESRQVFLCMLGDRYSGRMFGLKVPSFAAGIKVEEDDASLDMIAGLLDKLNARYGWGLIPQRVVSGGGNMIVLDSAKKEIHERLGPHERPALAVIEGWLVLCSNVEALAKLRDGYGEDQEAGGAWLAGRSATDVSACAWIDLETSCQAIKDVLSVYSLLLKVSDSRGSAREREVLAGIMAWIDLIQPLKTSFIEVGSDNSGCSGYFEFGAMVGTMSPTK